ncbi:MAG: 50S ribosomal protein L4 [Candidatus Saccharibacteria bacterium]|nr:50S ribosomal protein L4 [Candidatus Saccharibacteria bacterium]
MAETTTAKKPTLDKAVFDVEVKNHELLKLAYDSYLANSRGANATTKRRGEVRGGGKKPWKQKGTGRARFGSSRNPIWRGGGIVFGPLGNENYTKTVPATSKRLAVRQALTLAKKADKIVIADLKTTGKTSEVAAFIAKNKLDVRRVLLVPEAKTAEIARATKNIQSLEVTSPTYLTVYHILNADKIVISAKALPKIEAWLKGDK